LKRGPCPSFHARVFPVGKVEGGYVWDVLRVRTSCPARAWRAGFTSFPFLEPDYGRRPLSLLLFARLKLR